jgi:hypothetical protein
MHLSPLDPSKFRAARRGIAFADVLAGRYEEASLWVEKVLRERPNYLAPMRELAQPMRSPDGLKRWCICVTSTPYCASPLSKNGFRFVDQTT